MEQQIFVQNPNRRYYIESGIRQAIKDKCLNRIRVSVAYASVAGVQRFTQLLGQRRNSFNFKWLFGLDDYITQPGALKLCRILPSSTLRVVQHMSSEAVRFHPKMFYFESSKKTRAAALIGSANLTMNGLAHNSEIAILSSAKTSSDVSSLRFAWNKMWALGHKLTSAELDAYTKKYAQKQRKVRPRKQQPTRPSSVTPILTNDDVEVAPQAAEVCWIEVGRNTAMGRELEFKAEQALFFGLSPHGGSPEYRTFHVSDGRMIRLRLKYQENCMWRLQMNNGVPEVAQGLRPQTSSGLGRSPLVAVFTRFEGFQSFRLSFVGNESSEYNRIKANSFTIGCLGSTSTRFYGWF